MTCPRAAAPHPQEAGALGICLPDSDTSCGEKAPAPPNNSAPEGESSRPASPAAGAPQGPGGAGAGAACPDEWEPAPPGQAPLSPKPVVLLSAGEVSGGTGRPAQLHEERIMGRGKRVWSGALGGGGVSRTPSSSCRPGRGSQRAVPLSGASVPVEAEAEMISSVGSGVGWAPPLWGLGTHTCPCAHPAWDQKGRTGPQSPKLVGGGAHSLRNALNPREEPQAQGGKPRGRLSPTSARNL